MASSEAFFMSQILHLVASVCAILRRVAFLDATRYDMTVALNSPSVLFV